MSTRLHFKTGLLGGLLTSLLLTHGVVGAEPEVEPNDAKAQAQLLDMSTGSASISGGLGSVPGGMTTDLDVYAFDAKAGNVPQIALTSDGNWDAFIVLYDASGVILDMNDDAVGVDPRINMHRLSADGRYYLAVTAVPRYLGDNYLLLFTDPAVGGGYTLEIAGVTPAPQPTPTPDPEPTPPQSSEDDARVVTIKVRHWSTADNLPENRNRKNLIPVAIMSARDFDAMDVDPASLTFGATGDEASLHYCHKKGKNVRMRGVKDRRKDMVCYFKAEVAGFKVGDVQAFLKGKTMANEPIKASGALRSFRVTNRKEETWHERHKREDRDDRGDRKKRGDRRDRD